MTTLPKSPVLIAASITLVILLALTGSELRQYRPHDQMDFHVYLTAAKLVREHHSADIYNAADTGQNPQMIFAPADSKFQHAASTLGLSKVRLYVYPPTLADALVPFTFLSLQRANTAWHIVNILTILFAAALLTWILHDGQASHPQAGLPIAFLGILVAMLCFRSNVWAYGVGQISSVLLLLWTAGIAFYVKGFDRTSAILFALATAIKLTPLLVLLPFILWREARWVRWFLLSLASLTVIFCIVNGPHTLIDFAAHVMPPMSAGYNTITNVSLPSGIQQLYLGLKGVTTTPEDATVPRAIVLAAKLITAVVLVLALYLVYRLRSLRAPTDRGKILALIALMSLYCSPIAWRSAYGIVALAAFFLWRDAFLHGASKLELLYLSLCTLEFSFFFDTLFLRFTHGALLSATALIAPVSGSILILYTLRKMSLAPQPIATA